MNDFLKLGVIGIIGILWVIGILQLFICILQKGFSEHFTILAAQKMSLSAEDLFSKCEWISSFQRICSQLLKKSSTGKFIFCVVIRWIAPLVKLFLRLVIFSMFSKFQLKDWILLMIQLWHLLLYSCFKSHSIVNFLWVLLMINV